MAADGELGEDLDSTGHWVLGRGSYGLLWIIHIIIGIKFVGLNANLCDQINWNARNSGRGFLWLLSDRP